MRLLKRQLAIAALLPLTACVVILPVQSYTAVDGSSQADFSNNCVSPYPTSSTTILYRPDVRVRLDIYGSAVGDSTRLHAVIVVEPQSGTVARLRKARLEVYSPDFKVPLVTNGHLNMHRPVGIEESYSFFISMPTVPAEISMRFPRLDVQGETVELTSLALRSERRLQSINLMCQT
jgi:hypothetical protein